MAPTKFPVHPPQGVQKWFDQRGLQNNLKLTRRYIRLNPSFRTQDPGTDPKKRAMSISAVPLDAFLLDTPPETDPNDWPTFELQHAVIIYEDGEAVNILSQKNHCKMFLQGWVVFEEGNLHSVKRAYKDKYPVYINEQIEGGALDVSHATGHLTIWAGINRKWFEIKPGELYQQTYDDMLHLVGIFWENVEWAENPVRFEIHGVGQIGLVWLICCYIYKGPGHINYTPQEFLTLMDRAGPWLRKECLLPQYKTLLSKSPLIHWLGASEDVLIDVSDQTAEVAREILVKRRVKRTVKRPGSVVPPQVQGRAREPVIPTSTALARSCHSTFYPNGVQDWKSLGHIISVLAMFALEVEKKSLSAISLKSMARKLERDLSVQHFPAAVAILQNKRVEIRRQLPPPLHGTQLFEDLGNVPAANYDAFDKKSYQANMVAQYKAMYNSMVKGTFEYRFRLVRRGSKKATSTPAPSPATKQSKGDVEMGNAKSVVTSRGLLLEWEDAVDSVATTKPARVAHAQNHTDPLVLAGSSLGPGTKEEHRTSGERSINTPRLDLANHGLAVRSPQVAVNPHLAQITSFGARPASYPRQMNNGNSGLGLGEEGSSEHAGNEVGKKYPSRVKRSAY